MIESFLTPSSVRLEGSGTSLAAICDFFSGEELPSSSYTLAFVGVCEVRGGNNPDTFDAADLVRTSFFRQENHFPGVKIIDMGNILPGRKLEDTYYALEEVCEYLIRRNIIPVVIGGTHDLMKPMFNSFRNLERMIDLVSFDARLDMERIGEEEEESAFVLSDRNQFLSIISHQPSYLFNATVIGYQSYWVPQEQIELMEKLYFDAIRLGEARSKIEEMEPYIRSADIVGLDMSCIRLSDAPGNTFGSPNGFFGDEICQLVRYAGMNDKLSAFGIFEYNTHLDRGTQTADLIAQILWYFLDGVYNRLDDIPRIRNASIVKYTTSILQGKHELVFFKSKKSGRWWMEVFLPPVKGSNRERSHMVPCSYADYLTAAKEELPDKWWRYQQKYSF